MQFVNLTPFHSMAFQSLDLAGDYCTTVVTKVGYDIVIDRTTGESELHLIEQEPLPLVLADVYWNDDAQGSIKQESDLAPFKPRCDVLITGNAYAPEGKPSSQWPVCVRLTQTVSTNANEDQHNNLPNQKLLATLIDKNFTFIHPAIFIKNFLAGH